MSEHEEQVSSYIPSSDSPSAPPAEENNGFEQIGQNEIETAVLDNLTKPEETALIPDEQEVNKILTDLSSKITSEEKPSAETAPKATETKKICGACPYSFLGGSCLSKMLSVSNLPPNVQDLILWKCPKYTGAVFGTSLVLLLSMACYSLMTVVSTLILLSMTVIGTYRFYLNVVFRIKGTYDETFDKASAFDLSLPKDKIKEFAQLLDTDMNQSLNKLKSIVLWDSVSTSVVAFLGLYFVYCVGSVFNTITLLILTLVSLFTFPKVYQIYKKEIDQAFEKGMTCAHDLARQVEAKIPPSAMQFLHKFKRD
jgi:hypothetical protein